MLSLLRTIEPFALLLALSPLAGYLLVLGLVRISGRALVTTGARDVAALGLAIMGLIAVGPIELFFPSTAAAVFGSIVWLGLIAFYLLTLTLVCLTTTPKLVVYGRSAEETFPALLGAARQVDRDAVGDEKASQVTLPALGVQLRIDSLSGTDYCRILSFQPNGSIKFWNAMLSALRTQLAQSPSPADRRGLLMLSFGGCVAAFLVWYSLSQQARVLQGFRDWFWR